MNVPMSFPFNIGEIIHIFLLYLRIPINFVNDRYCQETNIGIFANIAVSLIKLDHNDGIKTYIKNFFPYEIYYFSEKEDIEVCRLSKSQI